MTYFIEDWGEMQASSRNSEQPHLCLVDAGGNVYTDWETADRKAEKYLREVDFPSRMDQETIDLLEKDYILYGLLK